MAANNPKTGDARNADRSAASRHGEGIEPPEPSSAPADYRLVFESAADAILVTDAEGRYIDANPRATELTGYSRAELLEMPAYRVASK